MDPALPSNASALLREQGLRPRKRWGQNFLCDRNILQRIVQAAGLTSNDRVLEIGAGLGGLTRLLADSSQSVTAVEIDTLMRPILEQTLAERPNARVIYEDFLKLDITHLLDEAFGPEPGVVVANIPYYITTPILERLIDNRNRVSRIVLLVQEEFARRLAAKPDTDDYGAMSIYAQFHARVEIVCKAPRTVFLPQPDVNSAVVAFTLLPEGAVPVRDEAAYFRLVHAAFGKRRKTLLNSLAGGNIGLDRESAQRLLAMAEIDPVRRGETLSLEEYAHLESFYSAPPFLSTE